MLFSEPKIPQSSAQRRPQRTGCSVSVLFSEPKIPQYNHRRARRVLVVFQCASASRKFLNLGSGDVGNDQSPVSVLFSEPKIPQYCPPPRHKLASAGFSALQRAENSSIWCTQALLPPEVVFQCSSASRKFLNVDDQIRTLLSESVSVLFSEPKIPQSRPSHLRPSIFPTAMITLRHS